MKSIFKATMAALSLLLVGTQVATADVKLVYSSWFPGQSKHHTEVLKPFFDRIAAESEGAISYELFTDGTIAGGRATLQAIRDGVVDMGLIANLYHPAELKNSALLSELATFMIDDAMVGTAAYNEFILLDCPTCVQDYVDQNIVPIGFFSNPPYLLLCNKPVASHADLSGLRVRAVGAWASLIDAAGGSSVNMTTQESYEALERGQIDCTIGSADWLVQSSLFDVVTHVNTMSLGTYTGGLIIDMNAETWSELDEGQREIVLRNASLAVVDFSLVYIEESKATLSLADEKNVALLSPEEDLVAFYAERREKEINRVIALASDRGIEGAEAMLDRFSELVVKWQGIVEEVGHDRDALAARLYDEVYSKLN
ncbi:C4-dicarboxylate TRAP transporter substrate-binding protein [Sneathiella litorea]|uniref:C4-dicarboxylate ABC transporter substrate-binding protein n=1 Tax=Sneathiella litorea TaxID=2606216 RepID=A0A6L8W6F8_9PROT|nr:C4-dicarboxylate TRAP transporter substrate-binding protein [Sneathiella litorea]MZR30691.1 hypothetical protein [Sneathiella litorea]